MRILFEYKPKFFEFAVQALALLSENFVLLSQRIEFKFDFVGPHVNKLEVLIRKRRVVVVYIGQLVL